MDTEYTEPNYTFEVTTMIIDKTSNLELYKSLIPHLDVILNFARTAAEKPVGTYPYPGGRIMIQEGETRALEGAEFESHKNFLDRYKAVLNEGDYIWFKTDNKNLFEFSLNSFAQENFKLENITLDLHNSNFEGNVITEYESRFIELGQPIYRLEAVYLGWEDNRHNVTKN